MAGARLKALSLAVAMAWLVGSSGCDESAETCANCQPLPTCENGGLDCPDPECGDGVVDADLAEACDDGNAWGGDGCTPWCTVEAGLLEVEPNNSPGSVQAIAGASTVHGSLPSGDRDCFAISVAEGGAVSGKILPDADGGCAQEMVVELFDADGVRVTSGVPTADGACAAVDPLVDTWARYLAAGDYALCVGGIFNEVVPAYTLEIATFDSCTELPALTPEPAQDLEGDGIADSCDPDDDNDGVDDASDNCPTAPNGPQQPFAWDTSDEGFVRLWLLLGPFTSGVTPGGCEPSPDHFAGLDDTMVGAAIGDSYDGNAWFAHFTQPGDSAVTNFNNWFTVAAPREAYAMTWIHAPDARNAVLAIGVDDGIRAWVNGIDVGINAGCQGIYTDQFQFAVSLDAGWNRLLTKVYDGGGGWGQIIRFYAEDATTPMTDLGVSIAGASDWLDNQGDLDNDGIGDICDPDPTQ